MLRVLKYGTGQEIPDGALFLSTQVEKILDEFPSVDTPGHTITWEKNALVWHYFLVECDGQGNPPPTRERP